MKKNAVSKKGICLIHIINSLIHHWVGRTGYLLMYIYIQYMLYKYILYLLYTV